MDMTGEQLIIAPRLKVWAALNDPEYLRQAIPGCQSVEKTSDSEFVATVVAKVGPVQATFKGKVTLSDIVVGAGYTIAGEGQGGAAGFGRGSAQVALEDAPEGTKLSYTAHASVGGKLAQIGSRLVDVAARKMADDFFTRFRDLVGSAEAASQAAEIAVHPAAAAAAPAAAAAIAPPTPSKAAAGSVSAGNSSQRAEGLPGWIYFAAILIVIGVFIATIAHYG